MYLAKFLNTSAKPKKKSSVYEKYTKFSHRDILKHLNLRFRLKVANIESMWNFDCDFIFNL